MTVAGLRVETVDTTVVPPADRFPLWLEMAGRVSAPVAFTSDHADDFRGHARMVDLGGIALTRFRYQSLVGQRTPRLIRQADPEVYQIALATSGTCAISARRRDTALPVGDFTLVDWGRPHDLEHLGDNARDVPAASATAVIPRARLPLSPDKVDRLTAARLSGSEGPGALLAQHLHRITRHPEEFRDSDVPYLADVTISLVSALLARHLDAEDALPVDVRERTLLARISDFIDRHLDDPALSPQAVADAHHVSLRTLHRLFQTEEQTVAATIRRRRLERCRRDLADPLLRHRPVHLVARRWGFTDKAHFSRAFRSAYGMSPQAYRARSGSGPTG
ncbi:helix-turn-helix domain-containing protein [Micromonospora globbae]|uniref:Helix-turn-helix domain-containing protein n=1 Tax=Micromonospora globbae TaxID=1894969 RepID=A0A420F1R1_9ACTN|nr:helix-turn-helix domain-containing protein [Micromonospora globbae]RKF26899.1 helix-turn-helix domain-containing protein [Micromonospora globbae]